MIIVYTSARLRKISPICDFTMHRFVFKVISLFFVCIHIGTAIDEGTLSLVSEGQAKLEVCLSKDAATHTCLAVVGCELLTFRWML